MVNTQTRARIGRRMMINNKNTERFLDPNEVSELLKINYRTLLNLVNQKKIIAYRIGRIYRIPISSINHFLEKVRIR